MWRTWHLTKGITRPRPWLAFSLAFLCPSFERLRQPLLLQRLVGFIETGANCVLTGHTTFAQRLEQLKNDRKQVVSSQRIFHGALLGLVAFVFELILDNKLLLSGG